MKLGSVGTLLRALWRFSRLHLAISVVLLFAISVLEGSGLAMLVPLFNQLVDPKSDQSSTSTPVQWASKLGQLIGIHNPALVLAFLAVLIFVVKGVLIVVQSRSFHHLLFEFELKTREEFLDQYLRADWLYLTTQDPGKIAAFVNGQAKILSESIYYLNWLLNSVMMIIVLGVIAVYLSPVLTLVVGIGFLLVILSMKARLTRSTGYGREIVRTTETISSRVVEILINAKAIKAGSLETEIQDTFRHEATTLAQAQADAKINEDFSRALLQPAMVVALLSVLLFGIYVLHMSPGRLLVFLGVGYRMLPPLSYVYNQYQKVLLGVPAFEQINAEMDEIARYTTARQPMYRLSKREVSEVELIDVSFQYDRDREKLLLRSIDLKIRRGEQICIQGPSGVGKSTLVDLMLGLIQPCKGRIEIDGIPLRDLDLQTWHRSVGYMGQDTILWNDTIYNNLCWGSGRQIAREEVIDWMELAGLSEMMSRAPKGLDTPVGERGSLLSGGEKQRLGLIRVLLKRPQFLLLDEVTSALDQENEERMLTMVAEYVAQTGALVLSITHHASWAEVADQTYWMENGILIPTHQQRQKLMT